MNSSVQWIEIRPDEIVMLMADVRELRIIRGTALLTHDRETTVLEMGERKQFVGDSDVATVISPVGDQSLIIATSGAYAATEWQSLMRAQYERMARHEQLLEAETDANRRW